MTELKSLTTPRRQMPFGGDFDQLFNRAMSRWPFSWPELAPSSEPRALRSIWTKIKSEINHDIAPICFFDIGFRDGVGKAKHQSKSRFADWLKSTAGQAITH